MQRASRWIAAAALGLLVVTLTGCNPSNDRAETAAFKAVYGVASTCKTTSEGQVTQGSQSYRQYKGWCGSAGDGGYLFASYYSLDRVPQPSGQPVDEAHVYLERNVVHTGPLVDCGGADLSKDPSGNWKVDAIFMC